MKKIGLFSDTHSCWDDKFVFHFAECDEIWHAGDIGNESVLEKSKVLKPTKAVYGNIDGYFLQKICPKIMRFKIEEVDVLLTHVGGYPNKYDVSVHRELYTHSPTLFVCGHSHILKIMYDKHLQLLYLNPGAAGRCGFHSVRTLLKFVIDRKKVKNLEIIELK